jgi:DNA gyrase subunit B
MTIRHSQARAKLVDCQRHEPGSGAELFLVEGDSAMHSVVAVRDDRLQAVLPLQGKPMNAWAAPAPKVAQHELFRQLAQALGPDLATARFDRVLLLFDPDADGIHIGALMLLYFQRWRPDLVDAGRVWMVRAPMFELTFAAPPVGAAAGQVQTARHAYHPDQCRSMATAMREAAGGAEVRVQAHRGLGGIAPEVLRRLCVDPATRVAHALGASDVQSVIAVFGGGGAC